VFVLRDPIERAISHYRHDAAAGLIESPIDDALRTDTRFLDFSRYAMQVEQWQEYFPRKVVRLVRFETYIDDRRRILEDLVTWMGWPPFPANFSPTGASNAAEDKLVARGRLARMLSAPIYKEHIRALVPRSIRTGLAGLLLTHGAPSVDRPSTDTVLWMERELRDDLDRLIELSHGAISWPLRSRSSSR
jgi:hypothetical protein